MTFRRSILITAAVASFAPALAMGAGASTVSLNAVLNGGNECDSTAPPAGPICQKGDLRGYGIATVTFPDDTTICVSLLVDRIRPPTAAHIHDGSAGQNGPVKIPLPTPNGGNPGASAGCIAIGSTLSAKLRANPAAFYVNVHNAQFPGGAIRGQLF